MSPVAWWRKSILWVWLKGLAILAAIGGGAALLFLVVSIVGLGAVGPEVVVPNVVRVPRQKAEQILTKADLTTKVVAQKYHFSVPEGRVISMRPSGGTRVRAGRQVELTVSKGPREIKVPDVVGKLLDEAIKILEDKHLAVGDITRRCSDQPAEEVIAQTPPAHQSLARGESVALEVSGGPEYGLVVDVTGHKTLFRRIKVVMPAGDSFQDVRMTLGDEQGIETIYDRIHESGDEITVDLQAAIGAQLRVYIDDKVVFEKRL